MRSGAAQFLQIKDHREESVASDGFAIKLNVANVAGTDPSVKGLIEKLEDKRANAEKSVFEQVNKSPDRVEAATFVRGRGEACAEMQGLTGIVLHELGVRSNTVDTFQQSRWLVACRLRSTRNPPRSVRAGPGSRRNRVTSCQAWLT